MNAIIASPGLLDARESRVWAYAFVGVTVAAGVLVAAAPLAAYVWLIALFGLPHVISELRYCDERFSGRSSRAALAIVGALLFALCATRLLHTYGFMSGQLGGKLELLFGAGLAFAAALFMQRLKLVGFVAALAIAWGAIKYPYMTFLIWAWLHNLTPMAFVAEATEGRARIKALALLAIPFFVMPGFVALGGLDAIAGLFGHQASAAPSALGAGREPLGAFLPQAAQRGDWVPLFQAAVMSQAMHYLAVIVLLPRLLRRGASQPGQLAPWPRWWIFYAGLAAAGLVSLAFYSIDFREARAAYALAATLHSWIELPIFLIALGGGFRLPALSRPVATAMGPGQPVPTPH